MIKTLTVVEEVPEVKTPINEQPKLTIQPKISIGGLQVPKGNAAQSGNGLLGSLGMMPKISEGEQSGSASKGSKGSPNKASGSGSGSGLGGGLLGALGMKQGSPGTSPAGLASMMAKMQVNIKEKMEQ